jgi:hypothetical protein
MDTTTATITVADLATELGVSVRAIAMHVSHLCREHGHTAVVHTAQSSSARSVLHGTAADQIRARYVNAA